MAAFSADKTFALAQGLFADGPFGNRNRQIWRTKFCPFGKMMEMVPAGSSVLDVGCGSGLFLGLLGASGRISRGVGIDISNKSIGHAIRMKSNHPSGNKLSFECVTANDALPDQNFDVVVVLIFKTTEDQFANVRDMDWMRESGWARISVFLVMLGVSPFLIDALYMRPEPVGLLFIVLAMLAYHGASEGGCKGTGRVAVAGLLLGSAAIMHPTFVVAGGVLGLYMAGNFLYRREFLYAALGTGSALLPIAAAASWFFANGDYAVTTILEVFSFRSPIFGGGD
jgi:hypothetical protein